ncbi:hypothetical protein LCGC14_1238710, partial [marine sediment metagenome]
GVAYTFDSENAVANQKKGVLAKLDSQRQANDTAMVTAIEHDQGIEELTSEQGAALIVAKQTIKAISPDQPGTTAAARFVFQETGRSQEKQITQSGYNQGARDMAGLLAAALETERETRAVDTEWRELDKPDETEHTTTKQTPPLPTLDGVDGE